MRSNPPPGSKTKFSALLVRFVPFLDWFPISAVILRGDVIAGITGALVLVPKAMAYAQLSGLPVYYGLYTAFVPAILGALWGSSRQLATGPVAIVSLMTAAAVTPLAVPFSEEYVGFALLLTLMVGAIQFTLGAIKLGAIVNFVSHPVILGFMNAAAIIIALSQLDLLLGIPKGRGDSFLKEVWETLAYLPLTHLPTLAMSLFALALMLTLKRIPVLSKASVLIAVVITTALSVAVGFEHKIKIRTEQVADPAARELLESYARDDQQIKVWSSELGVKSSRMRLTDNAGYPVPAADLRHFIDVTRIHLAALEAENQLRLGRINRLHLERETAVETGAGEPGRFYVKGAIPAGVATEGREWNIRKIEQSELTLMGDGEVVGNIPVGLPGLRLPTLTPDAVLSLLSAALIVALVAFMESIAMAKAMATKSKQRIDPDQELIGQGLANLGGAFFQAYPACGSFTGSAINLQAGAKTGFAMVFNGIFVAVTLLFLAPYLYHLPKAVLGVIVLLAVVGLVTPSAFRHTWQASRVDGFVSVVTFVVTLLAAPHLDTGIIIGVGLALMLFLYNTMKPRVVILGRDCDGALHEVRVNNHPASDVVTVIRFDARLYFANVSYFEDAVLDAVAKNPEAPYVLIVGDGINDIDASGEELIHHLVERLNEIGVVLLFAGLKKQVIDVMRTTGLWDVIGKKRFFPTTEQALDAIYSRTENVGEDDPLRSPTAHD